MNDFVDSLRSSTTLAFKRRYRESDVLLIDDVQFLENKEGLQEEFFYTFSDLKSASKQIVLASDRPPKSIDSLERRLSSRFLSGLIVEIDPPDYDARLAILRSKALRERSKVPEEVLEFIAAHVKYSIRDLEGALTRITGSAELNKEPISLSSAETLLSDIVPAPKPLRITPQLILEAVAQSYGLSVAELCGPSRTRSIVTARQAAMYVVREITDFSYPAIGRIFGKRDGSTVAHSVYKIGSQMKINRQLNEQVTELIQSLRGTPGSLVFAKDRSRGQATNTDLNNVAKRNIEFAEALILRFMDRQDVADLNRAISSLESLLVSQLDNIQGATLIIVDSLAAAYQMRFDTTHDSRDLDKAIELRELTISS
jgi:chromosomal replication initiator protein